MVKINLLNIPEEQKTEKYAEQPPLELSHPQKKEMDFSFIPDERDQSTAESNPPKNIYDNDPNKQPNPFYNQENSANEYEPPPNIDDHKPRSRWLLVILVVFLFAILGTIAYIRFVPVSSNITKPTTIDPNNQNKSKIDKTKIPQATIIPAHIQSQYAANQLHNKAILNNATKFIETQTSTTKNFLVVITSNYVYLSVLGDSRGAIARYQKNLKRKYPGLRIKLETTEEKTVGGNKKISADFSISISETKGSASSSQKFKAIKTFKNTQTALINIAKKNRLQTSYLNKKGDQQKTGNFVKTNYYVELIGKQPSIIKYLKDVTDTLPSVNFSKISLFPTNSQNLSRSNVKVHVELIIYSST